jgi:hypothetical protein
MMLTEFPEEPTVEDDDHGPGNPPESEDHWPKPQQPEYLDR